MTCPLTSNKTNDERRSRSVGSLAVSKALALSITYSTLLTPVLLCWDRVDEAIERKRHAPESSAYPNLVCRGEYLHRSNNDIYRLVNVGLGFYFFDPTPGTIDQMNEMMFLAAVKRRFLVKPYTGDERWSSP